MCPAREVEEFAAAVVGVGNNVACAATGARVAVGFFLGFERPCAGNHAVDGLVRALRCVAKQVQRDDGVFADRTALQEQNLVVVGDVEQAAKGVARAQKDFGVDRAAMAHFHDGDAGSVEIEQFGLHFF